MEAVMRELTLGDLRDWAGGKILGRARPYVSRVQQLSLAPDQALVAWVVGTERYATSVRLPRRGEYVHACSCPYEHGGPCKHAVALLLAAGEALKAGQAIPALDAHSDLARCLRGEGDDDAFGDDAGEDEEDGADDENVAGRHGRTARGAPRRAKPTRIAAALGKLDRDGLHSLLLALAAQHPEVARGILEADQLAGGRIDTLERSLLAEIRQLSAEPAWYNHWDGTGQQPDYAHLAGKLRALGERGHADALLRLGEELWTRGRAQVEQSDDDGDTAMALADCLGVVLEAVPTSSLSRRGQLLWIIERVLEDEYDLLEGAGDILKRRIYTKAHWREVVDVLTSRLDPGSGMQGSGFSASYQRNRLLSCLLDACARAGWKDRMVPLLEAEADACQCHARLVDELLAAGDEERARAWCIRGYASTIAEAPGIAHELQNRLCDMAQRHRRHDLVAAYAAQDFRERPSLQGYTDLRKAAERAICWPVVRDAALGYLESGTFPEPGPWWPLPAPEVERPAAGKKHLRAAVPNFPVLIEIAIAEQRLDDAVSLHQRLCKLGGWHGQVDVRVAAAVAVSHPDTALGIRRALAQELIARAKPNAYEQAAGHLRAMRDILAREQRLAEWEQLIAQLRTQHRAKRRLLETLDTLSSRRIAG